MADVFASPDSFFYNVGLNLIINGVEIYAEIDEAMKDFDQEKYFDFGENLGKALALVIMGPAPSSNKNALQTYQILDTFT